jgi:hypothetical protein
MPVDYFAQRLLNPFRGCIQVVRHGSAEAVSMDGIRWDIYVSNDSLLAGLDETAGHVQVSDIRYGSWSAEHGLRRGPLYPSEDFYRMEAMGAIVYEHLLKLHAKVPFPFQDHFECWLLDASCLPLVLLESAVEAPDLVADFSHRWQIGQAALERFGDAALRLMAAINDQASDVAWFHRAPDGTGTRLDDGEKTTLPAESFPPLLIRQEQEAPLAAHVGDYLAWLAPWLLLLDTLSTGQRKRLERLARARARQVEQLHRLYPEVADPDLIQAARVEARLTQSPAAGGTNLEDGMSTFYIELDPGEPV